MSFPAFRDIAPRAERTFALWGPNSGGGASVLFVDGLLYDVVYGDASRLAGGAEEVCARYTPAEFETRFANDPSRAAVIAFLRERALGTA